jgi:hypothetical protein
MAAMRRTKIFPGPLRLHVALLALAFALCLSGRAEARLIEIWADGYIGGMYGTEPKFCTSCVTQTPDGQRGADFFHDQSGGLLGLRAGVEVLFTDVYLQFDQFLTPNGFSGSSLQAMLGWDLGIGSGKWTGTLGGFGGMVFGFPYTPHPPIDKSQIATVGVAVEGQGGVECNFSRYWALQAIATVGYHYMFAGSRTIELGPGISEATRTHGFHLMLKAGIRFHIGL